MATKTEGIHSAEFLLSSEESQSLDKATLISGQNLVTGTVLGKITISGKYTLHNNAASDGSEVAAAILYDTADASAADMPVVIVSRLAEVADAKLIFKSGISAPNRAAALVALATNHITART
jgi:Bacteriophage lambda head decoration protein D